MVYMERQYQMFEEESKWDTIQFRTDPEMKEDMQIWCKQQHIPLSVLLRLVCARILATRRTFPGYQQEATAEITDATKYIQDMLPTINRQRQHNPRIY